MTNSELIAVLTERQELVRIMDEAKKQIEDLTNRVKDHMGSETSLIVGPYKVTWKDVTKTVADVDALKSAGLYDRFSKQQVTRPFKVT